MSNIEIRFDKPYCDSVLLRCCRGVAQPGRALGLGPRGREFKSLRPDQIIIQGEQIVHSLEWAFLCHKSMYVGVHYTSAKSAVHRVAVHAVMHLRVCELVRWNAPGCRSVKRVGMCAMDLQNLTVF